MEIPACSPPWHGRIRWQLALVMLIAGGFSVILLAAFAYVVVNMLLVRTSIHTVERQVELLVQMNASRAELFAQFAMLNPPRNASAPPPAAPFGAPRRTTGLRALWRCAQSDGRIVASTMPRAPFMLPGWLTQDRFAAITFDGHQAVVRAVHRAQSDDCQVTVLAEQRVDENFRELVQRASELEVRPAPALGRSLKKKGGGGLTRIAWSNLLGRYPRGLPVVVEGYEWATGESIWRPLFFVRPDVSVMWRQLTQLGEQDRRWVHALWLLGALFLAAELAAVILAVRLARHIARSVTLLAEAAAQVASGNLKHRVPVLRRDQLGYVSTAFNQMIESVERLIAQAKDKERLEEELRIARQVQQSLLPTRLPASDQLSLAAACLPARNISGDFYDFIELGGGRLGLLCADVSGKGVPAALLMSNLQAMVRAMTRLANGRRPAPSLLLSRLNEELIRRTPPNAFITAFWAEYEPSHRLLRWASAGHCPSLIVSPSTDVWLNASGLPLAAFSTAEYAEQEQVLEKDSLLVVYTDGVTEAERADGEAFGEQRLAALCRQYMTAAPQRIVEQITAAVSEWTGGKELADDVTLVVLKT